jgi:mannitol/fructose-specific phosphotransferase system IIA component (Ntr-type)
VVLSARRGTLTWSKELERLPGQLSSLVPESFLMVYPSETDAPVTGEGGTDGTGVEALPMALSPGRVVLDLPGGDYRSALREILSSHFPEGAELTGTVDRLAASEEEFSSEIREGVALPHALVPGLESPLMFLGIAPDGVRFPNAPSPARIIFILLGPAEKRFDHLRLLTRVARRLRSAPDVDALKEARDLAQVTEWFAAQGSVGEAAPPAPGAPARR